MVVIVELPTVAARLTLPEKPLMLVTVIGNVAVRVALTVRKAPLETANVGVRLLAPGHDPKVAIA